MTSHHDVAGLSSLIEVCEKAASDERRVLLDPAAVLPIATAAKQALESQAKALSEAKTAIHAGHLMANILFNLSQRGEMNADLRSQMAECQKAFDTAARAFTNAAKEKT